jgi:putative CocE/NonD family hydrolase
MTRDQVNTRLGYAPGLVDSVFPEHLDAVRAAKLQIFQHAGWFDSSIGGQLVAWKVLGGRITVGAWRHSLFLVNEGGASIRAELLPWFDQVLKGAVSDERPPVRYQTINARTGKSAWNYSAEWPLASQQITNFFLQPAERALTTRRPAATATDEYRINWDLVAFGGKFNRLARTWSGDMEPVVDASGLAYTSAPLEQDAEITGHPVAHLWISANAPDVNVLVYLEDVDAEGKSRFVTDGVVRASHRHREERAPWRNMGIPYLSSRSADLQQLVLGEMVELVFDLNPTSYLFRQGSRIRVTITGGEKNTYQQPTGFNFQEPPTITVYGGGAQASFVSLPVIPTGSKYVTGWARSAEQVLPAKLYRAASEVYGDEWVSCNVINDDRCTGQHGSWQWRTEARDGQAPRITLRGKINFDSD